MAAANPFDLPDITVIVINFRTLDLTERCVTSLLHIYPRIRLILTDNGSADESSEFIKCLGNAHPHIQAILHPRNIYHGPALHHAILAACTRFIFSLDSDCQVLQPGFLEAMLPCFTDHELYALGRLVQMNRYGYEIPSIQRGSIPYIHPATMMLDREKYLRLKPFKHHGSPGLQNMRAALRAGWRLQNFPTEEYIYHQGRGTCSRYGYGLGWQHVIEYFLNRIPLLTK